MIAVFRKAFYDSRKLVIWLIVLSILYVLLIMAFYPSMVEQSADFDKLIESYPKEMLQAFYGGDVEDLSMTEPGNYIQSQFLLWMQMLIATILMVQAFNAFTNAERDGTLDVMLSLPISRRTYYLGRVLHSAVVALILLAACWFPLWISSYIWTEFDVEPVKLALGVMGVFLPVMVACSFAYFLVSIVPSRMRFAGPLAYLFLFGSYIVYMFAVAIEVLNPLKPLFFFDYFNGGQTIRAGVQHPGDWAILAAVIVVYLALGWWRIDKKELGV